MNKNQKIFLILGIVLGGIVAGFYTFNAFIYNAKQADSDSVDLSPYFEEQIIALGVKDVGQPIEGFDPQLLMAAYPDIIPIDFIDIEAVGGVYRVDDENVVLVPDASRPQTSANGAISSEGYATLLENLSLRLSFPTMTKGDVDALIAQVNTGDRVTLSIGEEGGALGVTITPFEVVEDSRCPPNANCVHAGTTKVSATLKSGLGTANQIFELRKTITTEAENVTLIEVFPENVSGETISEREYRFVFEVTKR
ncbi:MAG: hypothetical protein WDZ88_03750 [Candidatus Paceibacterota bacterium]